MAKRKIMSKKTSRKVFTKNAVNVKKLNSEPPIMRGGIRL